MLLGMRPDEKLIFGYTHDPFINKEETTANTGDHGQMKYQTRGKILI